jgi:o-succinylbenzoate---CoA ligase
MSDIPENNLHLITEISRSGIRITSFGADLADIEDFIEEWESGCTHFTLKTSGSTGIPKSIRVSRQSMIRSAELTAAALDLKKGNTAFICMPLVFVAGKMMLVRALVLGLDLLVVKPASDALQSIPDATPIDFAAMTPMQVAASLAQPASALKLQFIKKLIIGGAPVNQSLENELQRFAGAAFETYGMTETLTHIALRRINGAERSAFFYTLSGICLRTDERGCLDIYAPHLDHPQLQTNDIVELIDGKCFRWLGRADNIINSGGIKIFPEQLEKKLEGFIPARYIITSLPDERLSEKAVLVIEASSSDGFNNISAKVQNLLGGYEKPREIHFLKKFPETVSGKISRKGIKEMLL